jgi:acyl carrier protein
MDPRTTVRELVEAKILSRTTTASVADDQSLLDSGLIDSMGVFELVTALEEACGVSIPDEELLPENFDSIDSIVALVERKREG